MDRIQRALAAELVPRVWDFLPNDSTKRQEPKRCSTKLFTSSGFPLAVCVLLATANISHAQSTPGPVGLSFDAARESVSPLTNFFAYFLMGFTAVWNYLMANAPAAGLLAAVVATAVAAVTIRNHREMTRLRETFAMMDRLNWDKDHIDARRVFADIREELARRKELVAKFVDPIKRDRAKAATLMTIMSNYENLALGVRLHIIDETFLHRYVRGVLLWDWDYFSPFVIQARHRHKNPNVYIEFEGIAMAWQNNKSYRTGKKLRRARLMIKVD